MSHVGTAVRVDGLRPVHIVQGEHFVTDAADAVLTTILGSCVAACLRDPQAGIGGMNHFLLPGGDPRTGDTDSLRYGVHAMELLVNDLLSRGARRDRLEGKLFGGARLISGLTDVGELNAAFAEAFMRREGLRHVGGSLRGECGRRIQYWPVSGRARQVLLPKDTHDVFVRESRPAPKPAADTGALELF
jgi:chemotaxis protein CheD